jgi:hypothetical protein
MGSRIARYKSMSGVLLEIYLSFICYYVSFVLSCEYQVGAFPVTFSERLFTSPQGRDEGQRGSICRKLSRAFFSASISSDERAGDLAPLSALPPTIQPDLRANSAALRPASRPNVAPDIRPVPLA